MKSKNTSIENKKERWIAILLVLCLVLVGFWEVMSRRSERPWDAFQMGAVELEGFRFECDGWGVEQRKVTPSPIDPEILKYDLTRSNRTDYGLRTTDYKRTAGDGVSVRARLVHGYNMVDCMRIKGYAVKLLHDSSNPSLPSELDPRPFGVNLFHSPSSHESLINAFPFGHIQIWELENSVGDKSIWVTSMLRAGDFAVLDVSTTDMAFPRVGVPDNPDWLPTGVTWKSFRHPIRNFKSAMRSKWNSSRCDLMVFLKLKQPVWADEEVLTLVTNSKAEGGRMRPERGEEGVVAGVLEAHGLLYGELVKWRKQATE